MEHNVTGHRAQLPDIPYWRANGWNPCDGPTPEPELTRDEPDELDEPEPAAKKSRKAKSTEDGEE